MSSDVYRQVELKRESSVDVAWIPSGLTKVGKKLKVKVSGEWQDGWVVTACYGARNLDEIQIQRWSQKRWADVLTEDDGEKV